MRLNERPKTQKCYRMGWKDINLRNKLWFMWWQTIISGANKRFIANNIMKEVSSDGATVSPVQPLSSETLQSFYHTSPPRLPPPSTSPPCVPLACLQDSTGENCFPVYRTCCVFTSSLCNCLRIGRQITVCAKKQRILVILLDYSTSTLRIEARGGAVG